MQLQAKFDFTKKLTAQEMALFEVKCRDSGVKPDVQLCRLITEFNRREAARLKKKGIPLQ